MAGVDYPERENYGVANIEILRNSKKFEEQIITFFGKFGKVKSQVRNKAGIADCVLECRQKLFVIEIKNYRCGTKISKVDVKQLLRYMKALNIKNMTKIKLKRQILGD